MSARSEWVWYGNAAHFICARWCRYHLATVVGPWIVSTVGEYVPLHKTGGTEAGEAAWLRDNPAGEPLGAGGDTYETAVFSVGTTVCQDAECGCGMPEISSWLEREMRRYKSRGEAHRGHLQLCEKWASVPEETGGGA